MTHSEQSDSIAIPRVLAVATFEMAERVAAERGTPLATELSDELRLIYAMGYLAGLAVSRS